MRIEDMPAGREMDALVAERVMEWTRVILSKDALVFDDGCLFPQDRCGHCGEIIGNRHRQDCQTLALRWVWRCSEQSWEDTGDPRIYHYNDWSPSTKIVAAWQVVEKMRGHPHVESISMSVTDMYPWFCEIVFNPDYPRVDSGLCDTAPLAVCRAALLACGVRVTPER